MSFFLKLVGLLIAVMGPIIILTDNQYPWNPAMRYTLIAICIVFGLFAVLISGKNAHNN
jgi:hypothetical protein